MAQTEVQMARNAPTRIRELPLVGRFASQRCRVGTAAPAVRKAGAAPTRWLLTSREYPNRTYDLTGLNKLHLACFIANATGASRATVQGYVRELEEDSVRREHIAS